MTERHHEGPGLSEQDLALVNVLQWAPRITWGDAAEILGAHPTTLATRWERLRETGAVWLSAQLDISDTPAGLAFVELSCRPGARRGALTELVAMPEVLSVDAFSGDPDIGLTVVTQDLAALSELVEERISSVPGVDGIRVMLSSHLHVAGNQWRLDVLDPERLAQVQSVATREQEELPRRTSLQEEHRAVVEVLMRDGRASAAEIARLTGLHPATARRYLQKVLASGMLSLRCDVAQPLSGFPLTVQWFTRVDAAEHAAAAERLAEDSRTRVLASVTGRANFLVVMWLSSVADILETEQQIQEKVPGIDIQQSVISLRPVKRLGWVLDPQGGASERFIVPELSLS